MQGDTGKNTEEQKGSDATCFVGKNKQERGGVYGERVHDKQST